jgi:tRNA threonylcarbamoyladenosine biosynthesis protein TsaB
MTILTIRTDKPEAELGIYNDQKRIAYEVWEAHRQLAETIHLKIRELLKDTSESLQTIEGIVVYKGPGSFTGLRIGITVANTLADSLSIPIIATGSEDWIEHGSVELLNGSNERLALPDYGAPVHITLQKK